MTRTVILERVDAYDALIEILTETDANRVISVDGIGDNGNPRSGAERVGVNSRFSIHQGPDTRMFSHLSYCYCKRWCDMKKTYAEEWTGNIYSGGGIVLYDNV